MELFHDYADKILKRDAYRNQLNLFENTISSLYDSAKPEIKKSRDVFEYLRKVVDWNVDQDKQLERTREKLDALLDSSILGKGDLEKLTKLLESKRGMK